MNRLILFALFNFFFMMPLAGQPAGGSLSLPVSLPGLTGDVTVVFEDVEAMTLSNLGISVQWITPGSLDSRLPAGASVPAAFPVLVRIEPPPAGGLAFNGTVSVQILGSGLLSGSQAPPRVYSAPMNGPFRDVTRDVQKSIGLMPGTFYRAVGSTGGFSEFLIVLDSTSPDQAIAAKVARLSTLLTEQAGAMPAAVHGDLAARLAAVSTHLAPGDEAAAVAELEGFIDAVKAHSGTDIAHRWRAARDLVNVAGQLRAAAETLRFSLRARQGS